MIPRGCLDIGWRDLLSGLAGCCLGGCDGERRTLEENWAAPRKSLMCLSVRSGLDAVLRALAFPPGSRVLVSAVTIPDMIRILEHHKLVPVPLPVRGGTLAVDERDIGRLADEQTRAVLIAHLFGSRMPVDGIAAAAKQHGLVMLEDCAQAFDGGSFRGHLESDAAMFSFGPIKTATALGGAMLVFRDEALREKARAVIASQPRQAAGAFARRLLKFSMLKLLTTPVGFGLLAAGCRLAGRSHDELVRSSVRGFSGDLISRIRHQPSRPLERLLARRLRQDHAGRIASRIQFASTLVSQMPGIERPGASARDHCHWVLPVRSRDPDGLARWLWSRGFDATRYGSSLVDLADSAELPSWARGLVYLPMRPEMPPANLERLAALVVEFEAQRPQSSPLAQHTSSVPSPQS